MDKDIETYLSAPLGAEDGWTPADLSFAVRIEDLRVGREELVANLPCLRWSQRGLFKREHIREKQCGELGSLMQNQSIFQFF